jgi:hypothetical protein
MKFELLEIRKGKITNSACEMMTVAMETRRVYEQITFITQLMCCAA